MTSITNKDAYDENCVFNRIFAENPKTPVANSADRLERIFKSAKAPAHETINETINVADFLPIY